MGIFKLHVWDPVCEYDDSGDVISKESLDPILAGASGVILMFDNTMRISYKLIPSFFKKVNEMANIRCVLVGNKVWISNGLQQKALLNRQM